MHFIIVSGAVLHLALLGAVLQRADGGLAQVRTRLLQYGAIWLGLLPFVAAELLDVNKGAGEARGKSLNIDYIFRLIFLKQLLYIGRGNTLLANKRLLVLGSRHHLELGGLCLRDCRAQLHTSVKKTLRGKFSEALDLFSLDLVLT